MRTSDFLATHPVFSLDEATVALAPPGGRSGTVQRLKHHLASVYTARRRGRLALGSAEIAFLDDPLALRTDQARHLGTRKVERRGRILEVAGPERTLVEGLRKPALAGGIEELLQSTGAFPTFDLALLREILVRYDTARLWAATGWVLEQHQRSFSVPDAFLNDLQSRRPTTALYLQRDQRGGRLAARWNLVLPEVVYHLSAADER